MHLRRERREGRQPRKVTFDPVAEGPSRRVERQRPRDLRCRAAVGRELELERRALAIHGGRDRDVVVTRVAAVEREVLRTQVGIGLLLERGPLRLEGQRERPRVDVPERRPLDVDLGRLSNRGNPSAEAIDVAARSHRDRHPIPGGLVC